MKLSMMLLGLLISCSNSKQPVKVKVVDSLTNVGIGLGTSVTYGTTVSPEPCISYSGKDTIPSKKKIPIKFKIGTKLTKLEEGSFINLGDTAFFEYRNGEWILLRIETPDNSRVPQLKNIQGQVNDLQDEINILYDAVYGDPLKEMDKTKSLLSYYFRHETKINLLQKQVDSLIKALHRYDSIFNSGNGVIMFHNRTHIPFHEKIDLILNENHRQAYIDLDTTGPFLKPGKTSLPFYKKEKYLIYSGCTVEHDCYNLYLFENGKFNCNLYCGEGTPFFTGSGRWKYFNDGIELFYDNKESKIYGTIIGLQIGINQLIGRQITFQKEIPISCSYSTKRLATEKHKNKHPKQIRKVSVVVY